MTRHLKPTGFARGSSANARRRRHDPRASPVALFNVPKHEQQTSTRGALRFASGGPLPSPDRRIPGREASGGERAPHPFQATAQSER